MLTLMRYLYTRGKIFGWSPNFWLVAEFLGGRQIFESEDDEDMPLTDESDSDDETAGPVVDDDEFEVFKVLDGVVDACCCRSPGPVWREPESLEGVVFV